MILLVALFACKADPCLESGILCTIAGTGEAGLSDGGTPGEEAALYWPSDVTVGPDGAPWVTDWNNHRIVRLAPKGDGFELEEVSGRGMVGDGPMDGPVSTALWNHPTNLIFREDGVAVFAAWHNSRVIALDVASDTIEHLAGDGTRTFAGDGGDPLLAGFDLPVGIAYGEDGKLYVADQANQRIRCIDGDVVTTVVGNGLPGWSGDGGPALEASLQAEVSQNADPGGRIAISGTTMYIADTLNHRIRAVDMVSWTITTFAGSGWAYNESTDPLEVGLFLPRDVAVGPDGDLYIADSDMHCIRRVADGVIETVAGVCGEEGIEGEGGPATEALLARPFGIDVASDGTLYIADTWNHSIRRVSP